MALALCVLGLFAAGIGVGQLTGLPSVADLWARSGPADNDRLNRPSAPRSVVISAIDVRADVVPVGLESDGSIAAPRDSSGDTVGWYSQGPSPGEFGPAVLVGHVDTKARAAVFHRLKELTAGELIQVHRRDRRTAVFQVDRVETFAKTAFPVKKIFGDFSGSHLVLVTCGGQWAGGDIGYADNVIVFAHRVKA